MIIIQNTHIPASDSVFFDLQGYKVIGKCFALTKECLIDDLSKYGYLNKNNKFHYHVSHIGKPLHTITVLRKI